MAGAWETPHAEYRNIDLGLVRETAQLKSADEYASQFSEKSDRQAARPVPPENTRKPARI